MHRLALRAYCTIASLQLFDTQSPCLLRFFCRIVFGACMLPASVFGASCRSESGPNWHGDQCVAVCDTKGCKVRSFGGDGKGIRTLHGRSTSHFLLIYITVVLPPPHTPRLTAPVQIVGWIALQRCVHRPAPEQAVSCFSCLLFCESEFSLLWAVWYRTGSSLPPVPRTV